MMILRQFISAHKFYKLINHKALCGFLALALQLGALAGCRPGPLAGPAQSPPPAGALENSGAPSLVPDQKQRGGAVFISDGVGTPRHFNPALVSGSATAIIGAQIFASPLRYDEHWNPLPYLAESWQISEDGLSVTLRLVEGAIFHDGQPITSADVAFSVQTVKEYHPFNSMLAPVERVDTPDEHTAILRLARPHPAILLAMSPALLPILPAHIYGDGQDLPTHPANLTPVGSGPFKFESYSPGQMLRLTRFDDFFIPGRPYLDEIQIIFQTDPFAQVVDMERQETHLLPLITELDSIDRMSKSDHLVITTQGNEGVGSINWLAFNLLRPPLNDKLVRQAIAYAVDADFITTYVHHNRTRRVLGPIYPDSPFYDPNLPQYALDLEKANALLEQAGHPLGTDGWRFNLALDYIPVIPSQQRDVALYIQIQLEKIGIQAQVRKSVSFPQWAERIGSWDFDLSMDTVYNWGDPVIGVHRTYLCDNIRQGMVWSNTQNYCNPQVDEILAHAQEEMDPDQRRALYVQFQQIVTDELPVLWINTLPTHTVYNVLLGNPPLTIWGLHSPLDELFWMEVPKRNFSALPDLAADIALDSPQAVARRALALLNEQNLYQALETLRDPQAGFLDLAGNGLHVIGSTRQGSIFMDNSGQLSPGIEIGNLLDPLGEKLLPKLLAAADGGGALEFEGAWPHPSTGAAGRVLAWCGPLTASDVVCAPTWEQETGE